MVSGIDRTGKVGLLPGAVVRAGRRRKTKKGGEEEELTKEEAGLWSSP